jgi:hypothetical protein
MKKLILNEDVFSSRPDAVRRRVYDAIVDIISDATCDLNVVIPKMVPGYDANWCAEESSKFNEAYRLIEKLATVHTDILFENM